MCVCVCVCVFVCVYNYVGYSVTFRHVITFQKQTQNMNPQNTVDLHTVPLLIHSSLLNTVIIFSQTGELFMLHGIFTLIYTLGELTH